MKTAWRCMIAATAASALNAQVAGPTMPEAGKAAIGAFVAKAVERGDVPGVVTLIVAPGGVLYMGAAGKQDVARGVAMSADSIFRIASMTKPVTSVALMMLVEQGKVQLDDPVAKYLPA